MRVKFKNDWFGPSDPVHKNALVTVSGQRFRKGVQMVPDWMKKYLPSSAVVLDGKKEAKVESSAETLADHDIGRISAEESDRAAIIAEKRLSALAKAREAKAAKKE